MERLTMKARKMLRESPTLAGGDRVIFGKNGMRVRRGYFYSPKSGIEGWVERLRVKGLIVGKAVDNWNVWPKGSYYEAEVEISQPRIAELNEKAESWE